MNVLSAEQCLPIAVVIPAYNAERFLDETLESVWAQSAPPSEVIVVDDGSTDSTAAIARRHRVTVLSQRNIGPSEARNAAIRHTAQPWVALLDADDVWEPDKLARQWEAVQACPEAGAVFSDFIEFDETGPIGAPYFARKPHYWTVKRTEVAPGVMACDRESLGRNTLDGNFFAPSTLLVRRSLLLQIGLFDPTVWGREDIDCILRLLTVCAMAVVERPLMRTRVHPANLSRDHYRMAVAGIALAQRVLENPSKYPPGAVERYRQEWPRWELNAGRFAEERGNMEGARRHYVESWRLGGGFTALGSTILTRLPRRARVAARALRHRLLPGRDRG
ncbi:MAG TPA: glycosyltransferase family A protein [Candidatus Dormibacteraeota bacterium]|nr:glycosyltransferase family A protein [Candidatus Dormibacteraeota bacterium]